MNHSLAGKTALITGAAVRLGREIALALADRGVDIVLHYHRSQTEAEQTADEIRQRGAKCHLVRADLSQAVSASTAIFKQLDREGVTPEILINSAALFVEGTLPETTESMWDTQFDVNLKAPFFLSQQFAQRIRARNGSGAIVNLCDWRGLRPVPGHDAYTLTKAALVALTKLLAIELAPAIRVGAIAPGAVLPTVGDTTGHSLRGEESIPLKRTGTPAEIVRAVLFLLESEFITGEIISVDGGEGL